MLGASRLFHNLFSTAVTSAVRTTRETQHALDADVDLNMASSQQPLSMDALAPTGDLEENNDMRSQANHHSNRIPILTRVTARAGRIPRTHRPNRAQRRTRRQANSPLQTNASPLPPTNVIARPNVLHSETRLRVQMPSTQRVLSPIPHLPSPPMANVPLTTATQRVEMCIADPIATKKVDLRPRAVRLDLVLLQRGRDNRTMLDKMKAFGESPSSARAYPTPLELDTSMTDAIIFPMKATYEPVHQLSLQSAYYSLTDCDPLLTASIHRTITHMALEHLVDPKRRKDRNTPATWKTSTERAFVKNISKEILV